MRVLCKYCDNAVELDGSMKCPSCGGSLGEYASEADNRLEQERLREFELEKQRLKKEASEADDEKWGKILGSAAMSGLSGRSFLDRIGHYINKFLKSIIIIAIILAVVIIACKLLG